MRDVLCGSGQGVVERGHRPSQQGHVKDPPNVRVKRKNIRERKRRDSRKFVVFVFHKFTIDASCLTTDASL